MEWIVRCPLLQEQIELLSLLGSLGNLSRFGWISMSSGFKHARFQLMERKYLEFSLHYHPRNFSSPPWQVVRTSWCQVAFNEVEPKRQTPLSMNLVDLGHNYTQQGSTACHQLPGLMLWRGLWDRSLEDADPFCLHRAHCAREIQGFYVNMDHLSREGA